MKGSIFYGNISILLFLLLILPLEAIVQGQPLSKEQFIKGCATYRSVVVHDIIDLFIQFGAFSDSLKNISDVPEYHDRIKSNFTNVLITHFSNTHSTNVDPPKVDQPDVDAGQIFPYIGWIIAHTAMLQEYSFLVQKKFIEPVYPHKLLPQDTMWQEVDFFNIQAGDTIVDIGTGAGFFPMIIALAGIDLDFYVTEINDLFIAMLHDKAQRLDTTVYPIKLSVIKGKPKDANLGNIKAHKIIMRESFHHFSFPVQMLRSIKQHLRPNGSVFVSEDVIDFNHAESRCNKIISRKRILNYFEKEGFCLLRDQRLGSGVLLEFKLRPE